MFFLAGALWLRNRRRQCRSGALEQGTTAVEANRVQVTQHSDVRTAHQHDSQVVQQPQVDPPNRQPAAMSLQAPANRVFNVQWSFLGTALSATCFKRPAGSGPKGEFIRPDVDEDDYYKLVPSSLYAGHYALEQYAADGTFKSELTTFGRIKAISAEALLYSGDGQYGTLIARTHELKCTDPSTFENMVLDPPRQVVFDFLSAPPAAAKAAPACDELRPKTPQELQWKDARIRVASMASRVRFDPRVCGALVPSLTDMPEERKVEYWWQESDFAEFLRVRVEIGKAYREAARKLGVPVMFVSSVGSHGEEGYHAMIQAEPKLRDESRRGLGLGRKKQRAKNRDAYIGAVLAEQSRQREEADVNPRALAAVAERYSQKDREYAHFLARTYYEQDRSDTLDASPAIDTEEVGLEDGSTAPESPSSMPEFVSQKSFRLNDEAEEEVPAAPRMAFSKGFGLSRDKLQEAGLSATGHAISKYQRLRKLPSSFHDDSGGESEGTCGETDGESEPTPRGRKNGVDQDAMTSCDVNPQDDSPH